MNADEGRKEKSIEHGRGHYARIHLKMWGDEAVRSLSKPKGPDATSLFLYFLTAYESTPAPGLLVVFADSICRRFGWRMEDVMEPFDELKQRGMALADWDVGLVFLPNAIRYKQLNPNIVKGWFNYIEDAPECDLKLFAIHHYYEFLKRLPESFRESYRIRFRESLLKPLPISYAKYQEHDQEQDHNQKHNTSKTPASETIPGIIPDIIPDIIPQPSEPARSIGPSTDPFDPLLFSRGTLGANARRGAPASAGQAEGPEPYPPQGAAPDRPVQGTTGLRPYPAKLPQQGQTRHVNTLKPYEDTTQDSTPEIMEVYEHYLHTMGLTETQYRLTPRRKQKIRSRLTEFDTSALCAAIDACKASPFHMGDDSSTNGKQYCDLADHILKTEEKVENWIRKTKKIR